MDWTLWLVPIWQRTEEQDMMLTKSIWQYKWSVLFIMWTLIYIMCVWEALAEYRKSLRSASSNELKTNTYENKFIRDVLVSGAVSSIMSIIGTIAIYLIIAIFWIFSWYSLLPIGLLAIPIVIMFLIRLISTNLWFSRIMSKDE